jgi:beta-lactamase regulating signal transducer with metallopeptidase domain
MTIFPVASEPGMILAQIVIAAVRTTVLAASAPLLLKLWRVKSISARLLVWKFVLCVGLIMPILGWLLPPLHVPIRYVLLPAAVNTAVSAPHESTRISPSNVYVDSASSNRKTLSSSAGSSRAAELATINARPDNRPAAFPATPTGWAPIASGFYAAVALFFLSMLLVGWALARRLLRASKLINDSCLTDRLCSYARVPGSRTLPPVYESSLVAVPITIGIFNPTILLPSIWRDWDNRKLGSVLTHEMSHVARRDSLAQFAALLHRAIFWFSPLAWWLNRHLSELAEEASDEAALSAGAERKEYARNVLTFFEALHATHGRVRWQGVSIAAAGQAEKRLEKILGWRGANNMNLNRSTVLIMLTIAAALAFFTAAVRPVRSDEASQNASATNQQSPAPATSPNESGTPAAAPATPSVPQASASPESPAEPGSPAAPPEPPHERSSGSHYGNGYSYAYGFDDQQRFVIVSGKMDGFTMSGSSEDARHVEKLKKQISGDFIWFQRDEKSYIVRDQATIDRARQLWAPQEELGKKQEELGKQQEALGKQQEELGARMQEVRVKVPDMTAELDKLKAELRQLGPNATMEQIGNLQSEVGELQSKMGNIQSQAGDAQGKIGEEMGALGEKQGKLGEQQGELGRQQGELAEKATKEMKKLLDDAIKDGKAQPEPEHSGSGSV